MAAAYRAGAALRDMEFMQFHPTVLYVAGSSRFLISEAVRGEGAYLRDKHMDRFMLKVDPRAELAPRDVVAQAIVRCMERTKHPNVYLDLRHLDKALMRRRFPGIDKVCRGFGLDITSDLIPIRPGAHYMMGGVTVDDKGQTTLPGLWAAGEVTSSGLHGANRLASNSLLEGLVFGAACARGAASIAGALPDRFTAIPLASRFDPASADTLDVADITNSLRSMMVRPHGRHPRTCGPGGSAARRRLLVPLRVAERVRPTRRLGIAKSTDDRAPDDPRGSDARGIARRPLSRRLPRARRRPLATAYRLPAVCGAVRDRFLTSRDRQGAFGSWPGSVIRPRNSASENRVHRGLITDPGHDLIQFDVSLNPP